MLRRGIRNAFHSTLIVAGLLAHAPAAEANAFRLVLETDNDAAAGSEVFAVTYATFNDFINSPAGAGGSFSGINIASGYSVAGLAYEFDPPQPVAEPATVSLLALGAAAGSYWRRRRNARSTTGC